MQSNCEGQGYTAPPMNSLYRRLFDAFWFNHCNGFWPLRTATTNRLVTTYCGSGFDSNKNVSVSFESMKNKNDRYIAMGLAITHMGRQLLYMINECSYCSAIQ